MKEIVINKCYGGFGLSYEAVMLYAKLKGIKLYANLDDFSTKLGKKVTDKGALIHYTTEPVEDINHCQNLNKIYFSDNHIPRDDIDLVKVVKQLGDKANNNCAKLGIVKIPDDIKWIIEEYDGMETIAEQHRTWG